MDDPIPRLVNDRFLINQRVDPKSGAMGHVYKATDTDTKEHSTVALKWFHEDRLPEVSQESWNLEVKSLNTLNDCENIVRLIDFDKCKQTGRRFIALEWVENTLSDFIGDDDYGWDDYYKAIGRPILNALVFAFKHGIYHRDIKPENILVTDNGIVKVVDFGIAQFAQHFGVRPKGKQTFVLHASYPFAPPWLGNLGMQHKRDIYSFAVLSLCIVNQIKSPDEELDVQKAIVELDASPEVCDFLISCASDRPEEVPESINDVFRKLEAIQREREKHFHQEPEAEIIVDISLNAITNAPLDMQSGSGLKTKQKILADLNRGCAVSFENEDAVFGHEEKVDYEFVVCTDDYVYGLRSHNRIGGALAIVYIHEVPPQYLEELRERSWVPSTKIRFCEIDSGAREIKNGKKTIDQLVHNLAARRHARQLEERERAKYQEIQIWEQRVQLRREQDRKLLQELRFSGVRSGGSGRKIFELESSVEEGTYDDFYEESFCVMSESQRYGNGILEWVERNEATLFLPQTEISSLPGSGELKRINFQGDIALKRQDDALAIIREGLLPNRSMTQALLIPETCTPSQPVEISTWHQSDLDNDKKRAVKCVLGSSDISVIEGPPGTGKTKLIAEIILQYLRRNPKSKILLASQTHIAVDHALEKVAEAASMDDFGGDSEIHMVRFGDRENVRIAKSSHPYLLGPAINKWRDGAKIDSQQFLETWGESRGIDRQSIELGIALRGNLILRERLDGLKEEQREIKAQADRLKERVNQAIVNAEDSTVTDDIREQIETNEFNLSRIKEQISETKKELKSAEKEVEKQPEGSEYLKFDTGELKDWVDGYLTENEEGKKFQRLFEIQQEWFARFQDTDEFTQIYLDRCELVAGTCVGIARRELRDTEFDLCIVDEASKATPGEAVVPLVKAKQWVLVGDPKQLPPFAAIDQNLASMLEKYDGLKEHHLKESLLDHFLARLPQTNCFRLTKQYRMTKPIGDLVSHIFYEGELASVQTQSRIDLTAVLKKPVTWFSTSALPSRSETRSDMSYLNLVEVKVIRDLINKLLDTLSEQGVEQFSICLLSGYAPQVQNLKRILRELSVPDTIQITACTVDAFQGQEADVAIYSVTRSNENNDIGFLRDKARLNVALSRARSNLVIVGDVIFCKRLADDSLFPKLVTYIQENDDCAVVRSAP